MSFKTLFERKNLDWAKVVIWYTLFEHEDRLILCICDET